MIERTLAIIKPDAVNRNAAGEIISMIYTAGFTIIGMKLIHVSEMEAGYFYEVHREKPFYKALTEYMSSGKIIPIALEKDNAINDFRHLIGNTDPALAEAGTIRHRFGESKTYNSIHGSDSVENGNKEILFFFSEKELLY